MSCIEGWIENAVFTRNQQQNIYRDDKMMHFNVFSESASNFIKHWWTSVCKVHQLQNFQRDDEQMHFSVYSALG